ncbi:GNAT family N-acetyltransferase [Zophobihabitans entericus]|uniref:GNAT family N-acetyltransferase n=1 Tax=Zophobihabitans entericus TaxID=1635327 RepID=A0A6G9IBK8_9GAMM|nr:GNAT family N-acetyltransferase [Zophobihabitans entericus]QIQ21217.1 GNAT family N-acetyltransferase [Zophobihabitans entericus]
MKKIDIIQRQTLSDIQTCADIWLEASIMVHHFIDKSIWQGYYSSMVSQYLPSSDLYLALESNQILGFAAVTNNKVLEALFIHPIHWRQGIGKQLIDHISQIYPVLTLAVYQRNQQAVNFYQQQGFILINSKPCKHTGHTELILERV